MDRNSEQVELPICWRCERPIQLGAEVIVGIGRVAHATHEDDQADNCEHLEGWVWRDGALICPVCLCIDRYESVQAFMAAVNDDR